MRNLQLVDCKKVDGLTEISDGQLLTVDLDVGTVYIATSNDLLAINPHDKKVSNCFIQS